MGRSKHVTPPMAQRALNHDCESHPPPNKVLGPRLEVLVSKLTYYLPGLHCIEAQWKQRRWDEGRDSKFTTQQLPRKIPNPKP